MGLPLHLPFKSKPCATRLENRVHADILCQLWRMRQTVPELFDSVSVSDGPVLCTFMQYLITFCSLLEVASDVISGEAKEDVCLHVCKI